MSNRPEVIRLMPVMDYGGVETIVSVLAEQLPRDRYDFRVCTFWKDGDAADRVRRAGIPCDVLDVDPALRNPRAPLALARYLVKRRPALLHASISEANFHASVVSRTFPRLSLLLEEVGTPERSAKARRLFGLAYRRADALIGVSRATCDYLIERERAPRSRTHLIYNCVDERFFAPHPRRNASETFRVGFVGRLVREKNHRTLLAAWARFTAQIDGPAELHIIGDGPCRAEIETQIEMLGIGPSVVVHGFRNDVPTFVESLDAMVLPSTNEGYGIALVEAMAQAVPVIGSDAGGVPEVLEGYGKEWVVPALDVDGWRDALLRLHDLGIDERRRLGERGQMLARDRFSPAKYIDQVVALYDELLER